MKNRNTTVTTILLTLACFGLSTALHAQVVKLAVGGGPMASIDLPGSDIKSPIKLPATEGSLGLDMRMWECLTVCSQTKDCVAWTYVRPNTIQGPDGNCWLKNSIPQKKSSDCCDSGTIGEANTDRPGSDLPGKHYTGSAWTAQACQQACYKDAKCMAWTFVKGGPNAGCWLKDSVPPPVPNNACISGYFRIVVIK